MFDGSEGTSSPWDEQTGGDTAAAPPAASGPLVLGSTGGLSIESQADTMAVTPSLTGQVTQLSGDMGPHLGVAVPEQHMGSWWKGIGICFAFIIAAMLTLGLQLSHESSWDDNRSGTIVSGDSFVNSTFTFDAGEPIGTCSFNFDDKDEMKGNQAVTVQGEVDSLYVYDDCDGSINVDAQIVSGSFDVDNEQITINLPEVYPNSTAANVKIIYQETGSWRSKTMWLNDVWISDGVNTTFSFYINTSNMDLNRFDIEVNIANDAHSYYCKEWYGEDADGNRPLRFSFEQNGIGTIDYSTGHIEFTLPFEPDNETDYWVEYEIGSEFGGEGGEIAEEIFLGFLGCCMPLLLIAGWIGMLVRSFVTEQQSTAYGMLVAIIPGFLFFFVSMIVISIMFGMN
jgi:hypothetical protein